MGTKRKKMPEGLEKHTSALIRSSWTSVHDSRWRFPSLHAIILSFLYITSQWLISSVASLLHASSPGAPSVHLLISWCAGKPPVQERQEDQEMASGMKIRKKKKKNRHRFVYGCYSCFVWLCFSLCRVLQMFINITKHRTKHCAGWRRTLRKSLPQLFVPRIRWH